jgi:hypothetical protein
MQTLLKNKIVFSKNFPNTEFYDIDCEYYDSEIIKISFTEYKKIVADTSLKRSFVAFVQQNDCCRDVQIFQIID